MFTFLIKNSSEFLVEQRAKSYEQRASSTKFHLIFDLVCFAAPIPDTSATKWVRHERHEMSETRATQVRHERYTNDASVKRAKNFDFDNGTSENIFLHHYISYIADERLQGEK